MQYKDYEHITERGLNLYLAPYRVCQQDEIEYLEKNSDLNDLNQYNIYFICQRNRIGIQSNYIQVNNDTIDLRFDIWDKNDKFTVPYGIKNDFSTIKLSINSDYPYNYFELLNEKKEVVYKNKSAYLLDNSLNDNSQYDIVPRPSFLDFEILYIGKTKRNSVNRLINHSTLQKISLTSKKNNPDKEIYLILCSFIMDGDITISGKIKNGNEKKEEQRLKKFMTNFGLTHKQKTNLVEAMLIRYFQPEYNTQHKNSFPTKRNSSYDECYDLDLNAVSIELNTSLFFYTKKIKPSKNHFHRFDFFTENKRRKLFDFLIYEKSR